MKVSELIKWLGEDFDPAEDVIVSLWRRDLFTTPEAEPDADDQQPTVELWAEAVETVDRHGWGDYLDGALFDTIQETIDQAHASIVRVAAMGAAIKAERKAVTA